MKKKNESLFAPPLFSPSHGASLFSPYFGRDKLHQETANLLPALMRSTAASATGLSGGGYRAECEVLEICFKNGQFTPGAL